MGWGSRVHRPSSSGAFGGKTARYRPRVVIAVNEVTITEPLFHGAEIRFPSFGRDLDYATDLYQRIYTTTINDLAQDRTVQIQGALYSAPAGGGGEPPDPDAAWTIVSASDTGILPGHLVHHVFQDPSWFTGLAFVDIWTYVYQSPTYWTKPFTVVHELWGNFFRWNRVTNPSIAGIKPENTKPGVKDTSIRILGKHRG